MSFDAEFRDVVETAPVPRRGSAQADADGVVPQAAVPPLRAATPHPFVKAFTCAGIAYLLATAVLLVVVGFRLLPRATSPEFGDAIAGALVLCALPAIVSAAATGLVVSLSPRVWRTRQVAMVLLPVFLLLLTLQLLAVVSG
jgi:hypothetical protein